MFLSVCCILVRERMVSSFSLLSDNYKCGNRCELPGSGRGSCLKCNHLGREEVGEFGSFDWNRGWGCSKGLELKGKDRW